MENEKDFSKTMLKSVSFAKIDQLKSFVVHEGKHKQIKRNLFQYQTLLRPVFLSTAVYALEISYLLQFPTYFNCS